METFAVITIFPLPSGICRNQSPHSESEVNWTQIVVLRHVNVQLGRRKTRDSNDICQLQGVPGSRCSFDFGPLLVWRAR